MKPINKDEPGCNYTSSNCVIWQGPDIPCIKICKGDSVSDVVFKLATELCDVLDTLDVSKYDISCLNLSCAPANFHDFLQILINTICGLQGGSSPSIPSAAQSSDTVIPVAPCFYYTNEFGDQVFTMTISGYATAIGNRLCNLETRVSVVEITVAQHTDQINTLQSQVEAIPSAAEETIIPICSSASVPTPVNEVVNNHEVLLCQYQGALGTTAEIYASLLQQCAGLGTSPQLAASASNMNSLPGWNNDVLNMAGALNNLWLSICDIRTAVTNLKLCCNTGCDAISLSLYTSISGSNLSIFITGPALPTGATNCATLGSPVKITDGAGGVLYVNMDIITFYNLEYVVALPAYFNLVTDITTDITACIKLADGSTCESCLIHLIEDPASCPTVTYTPGQTDIGYSFTSVAGTATYTVEVYTIGNVLVTSDSQVLTGPAVGTGTLVTGSINSTFKLRLVITADSVKTCPFANVVLLPTALTPIALATAADFAVLAGSGITNTGTTTIVGDVGSDPTNTIVGLVPGDVTGTLYTASDPAVIQAKVDLTNAITDAGTRIPLITVADMIGGTTLNPGYYDTTTGTIDITGTVTLDGLGDVNSIFMIKAATTLITANVSMVTLINGAQFNNIFWIVGSSATLGTGSVFKGNILATTSITVTTTADVQGRLLANGGAVTLDTNTVSNI